MSYIDLIRAKQWICVHASNAWEVDEILEDYSDEDLVEDYTSNWSADIDKDELRNAFAAIRKDPAKHFSWEV